MAFHLLPASPYSSSLVCSVSEPSTQAPEDDRDKAGGYSVHYALWVGLRLSLKVDASVPSVSIGWNGCLSGIHPEELAEARTLAQLFTRLKGHTWSLPGL